jgi:hypothetical protein
MIAPSRANSRQSSGSGSADQNQVSKHHGVPFLAAAMRRQSITSALAFY